MIDDYQDSYSYGEHFYGVSANFEIQPAYSVDAPKQSDANEFVAALTEAQVISSNEEAIPGYPQTRALPDSEITEQEDIIATAYL